MKLHRIVFLWPLFFLILYACNSNEKFTMGDELVNMQTDVFYSDTSTLRFYTIIRDSVITSGTGKALVGRYNDGNFGTIKASSFFQVGPPSYSKLYTDASFDSLTLSLYSSGASYGDTTKWFTIEVREVKDRLYEHLDENGYRYNVAKVNYDTENLYGCKTFEVRPIFRRRVDITLDKVLGEKLFNLLMNQSSLVTNTDYFVDYLRGLALISSSTNSSVLSFSVNDSSYMRMYYHSGGTVSTASHMDFKIINTNYQYNHIEADRSSSPLKTLKGREDQVSSIACGNESYCQGGFGMMAKIEIPYLKNLIELSNKVKILKAELILSPIVSLENKASTLPSSLELYDIDASNALGSALYNSSGYQVTPTLTIDTRYGWDTQYVFDITYYIASTLNGSLDVTPAIAVSLPSISSPSTSFYNTLTQVIFGDRLRSNNVSKLKITYWRY